MEKVQTTKKVNNTQSTKPKSCTQSVKAKTKAKSRHNTTTKALEKACARYTQVIQRTKDYRTMNNNRFHISTPPNNTSSYLYINYLKDIKTQC